MLIYVSLQLCVVMFFCDGLSHERARTFIREMEADHVRNQNFVLSFHHWAIHFSTVSPCMWLHLQVLVGS